MSATEEVPPPVVEVPPPVAEVPPSAEAPPIAEAPATGVPKKEEIPTRKRKPRAPKEKINPVPEKPKTAAHPPYFQMIKEAILALNDKSGSSPYAIAKYMEEKHKAVLPFNFKKTLALQLKNSAARGKLIKIKASYKLSEAGKKDKAVVKIKVSKPKTEEKKTTKTAAVASAAPKAAKKVAKKSKKSTPAKPKQPKSIKSPAAKKPKKATA